MTAFSKVMHSVKIHQGLLHVIWKDFNAFSHERISFVYSCSRKPLCSVKVGIHIYLDAHLIQME